MDKQGKILGIPFDFRKPTYARMKQRMWNPEDERIMVPRTYGIGWTVNLYQLKKRSRVAFYTLLALFFGSIAWEAWKFFKSEPD